MSITIQNYRSTVAGANPDSLLPGQIAFNLADGTIFVGYGGDVNYDLNGNPVAPAPPAGQGWKEYPLTDAVGNVNQLIAGTNVTLSPANGQGNVTINANIAAATPTARGTVFGMFSAADGNIGIGQSVLQSASGKSNSGFGANCLDAVTTGGSNSAFGSGAGGNLTTGTGNTFMGASAGGNITSSSFNTLIGTGAGASLTGQQATYVGYNAGAAGSNQGTIVGYNAGRFATGLNNTFFGNNAGNNVTTGAGNTCIGYSAGSLLGAGSNNTLIGGYQGAIGISNQTILSDGAGNLRLWINSNGALGVGTTASYGASGQILTSSGTTAAPTWANPAAQNFTGVIPATNTPINIYTTTIANNGVFSAWGYLTVYSGNDVIKTYTVSFLNTYNSLSGMAGPGGVITAGASYTNPVAPEPTPSITVQYETGQGGGVVTLYATAQNAAFNFSLTLFRTV